ncbi:MAG: hypothetical protein ACON42_03570 [Flavobacteriaceae bacterium]
MQNLRPYHHFSAKNQRANCLQRAFPISVDTPEDNLSDSLFIQGLFGSRNAKNTQRYTQVSTQEIGNIVNPLDSYYQKKGGAIHAKMGCIEPLNQRDKENKHHRSVHT